MVLAAGAGLRGQSRPLIPDPWTPRPGYVPACAPADGPEQDRTYPLRKAAFAAMEAGDGQRARHFMRCAIQADASDRIALRQEVYLDIEAGDGGAAIAGIDRLRELGASDAQLEAQQGYLYAEQREFGAARAAFRRAVETGDNSIRLKAVEALGNLRGEDAGRTVVFALDSLYENRFNNEVLDGSARVYQRLGVHAPVQAFAGVRLLRDTASRGGSPGAGGALPQIFDDNALLPGVGVAWQRPGAHASLTAEANEAYVFYGGRDHTAAWVPDFRVVAGYYRELRATGGGRLRDRWSLEANGSFGFYSRYEHDGIAYLQPRESFDLRRSPAVRVAAYFGQSLALDTNRAFYNNSLELTPGVEALFKRLDGRLRVEYARGFYLPVGGTAVNPYGPRYGDLRVHWIWQRSIPLTGKGD